MGARLNLHPVGLNDEERKILSVAMNVLIAGGCGVRYCDQISQDTVSVIDVDSEEGRDFYEHSHDKHIRVVIAGDERSYLADGLIRKPLRVQALRNLLSDISEQILLNAPAMEAESTHVSTPIASGASPAADTTLPNDSLFYALVNAVATQQYYKIVCGGHPHPLLIHGPTRHIYTNMNRQELLSAAALEGTQLSVLPLEEFEFMKQAQGTASHRIEKVLWLSSESGSLGYPPVTMSAVETMTLNDWPRFDVKHVKPEYLTLAAIMTRHSLSLPAVSRISHIPLQTVFDFYHAALACGVVQLTSPSEPEQLPVAEVPSLVTRIARKLGLNFF